MHKYKDRDCQIKDFGLRDFEIISSTDHPYAIADAMRKYLRLARNSIDISAPWNSKSFVDMIRTFVPKPDLVRKRLITRMPKEEDVRSLKTVESFADLKNSTVMCKPYLHAKFIIIDNSIVLWGSVNPTSSGIYDNDEVLYVSKKPSHITRHQEIFDELWSDPKNTSWKNVQQYYGFQDHTSEKRIAEEILRVFDRNGNQEVLERGLINRVAKRFGVNKWDVKRVVEHLVLGGVLWRPKDNMVKCVNVCR